jgi:Fe(II)/alpha-ketoglutarate-dependent arginine beta-hydroxylase
MTTLVTTLSAAATTLPGAVPESSRLNLTPDEISSIQRLLGRVAARVRSVEDERFLGEAALLAHELPLRLRTFLLNFKLAEPGEGFCVISDYPVDHSKIGSTPSHWNAEEGRARTLEEEILFVLLASLLGDVFGWATQQNGRVIHEVLPVREYAHEQISIGSEQPIWWHNEDAFHPYRGDYVGLMCLRNPDNIATTVASVESITLDRRHIEVLSQPRYIIRPDKSHLAENNDLGILPAEGGDSVALAFERICEMQQSAQKVSVLSGGPQSLYIRIDPYFMEPADDAEAQTALDALINSIDEQLREVVLAPGDICFIDNYKAVHGRRSFTARYDGSDRWLKRINVTRDLRKSRGVRPTSLSRIIS